MAIKFTGEGDRSSWEDRENWDPKQVPSVGDDVIIEGHAVTLGKSVSVKGLRLAGTLTGRSIQIAERFEWLQGSLETNLSVKGTLVIIGSAPRSLSGRGRGRPARLVNLGAGRIESSGLLKFANGVFENRGTLTINKLLMTTAAAPWTVKNTGSIIVAGDWTVNGPQVYNDGVLELRPQGVLTMTSGQLILGVKGTIRGGGKVRTVKGGEVQIAKSSLVAEDRLLRG